MIRTAATALITSLVDIRLVGESIDMTQLDAPSREWLYSSYRLGEPTEFLWDRTRWNDLHMGAFATLVNFLPKYYERPRAEQTKQGFDDFDVYRSFGAGEGTWQLGIGGDAWLDVQPPQVVANVIDRGKDRLVTLINPSDASVSARVPVVGDKVVFEPLSGSRFYPSEGSVHVSLPSWAYRHVLLLDGGDKPRLLCALGASKILTEKWDGENGRLLVSVDAVAGTRIRFAVCAGRVPKAVSVGGDKVPFEWDRDHRLLRFDVRYRPDASFQVQF